MLIHLFEAPADRLYAVVVTKPSLANLDLRLSNAAKYKDLFHIIEFLISLMLLLVVFFVVLT